MPTNRHALLRYRTIDHCLQQRQRLWTSTDLAEACARALSELQEEAAPPSRSTICRDIRHLRAPRPAGYDAPISWDPARSSYYYSDPDFSIFNGPLREEDLRALDGALTILRQFRHFSQVSELEVLSARLQHSLKAARRQGPAVVQLSKPAETPAYRWLDLLYQATEQQQCLLLDYHPFQEEAFTAVVSPYLIKEYNNRWFLIGWNHRLHSLRTFALDRIVQATPYLLETYYRTPRFDPDRYFNDIIGVTLQDGRSPEYIVFRTPPLRAKYLLTKPVHQSLQVVRESAEFVEFSLRLIPNFELESWLLSFGEEVQVLAPEWLAERISNRLAMAVEQYGKGE